MMKNNNKKKLVIFCFIFITTSFYLFSSVKNLTSMLPADLEIEVKKEKNISNFNETEEIIPSVILPNNSQNIRTGTASLWHNFVEPWNIFNEEGALLLNFVNTDVINVLKYFESTFKVIFITDDAIQPSTQGGKTLLGSKINFTSNKALSRKDAWNVLITLLEMIGVTLQPGSMERTYRLVTLDKNSPQSFIKGPLPLYVGIPVEDLPDTDMRIRYLYLVKNTSLEAVSNIVKTMQSAASPDPIPILPMNGVLITDRVYNIRTVMAIIEEIDNATMPETMSIIKLKNVDATKVADLYKTFIKEETGGQGGSPRLTMRRVDSLTYFDPYIRIIPDPRTNSLIVLGDGNSVGKVEEFIKNYEEQYAGIPYKPVRTYQLKYTNSDAVAKIIQQAVDFKNDTDSSKFGGVKNGEKYFTNTSIISEPLTNTLIITSPDDEYKHVYSLIQSIDVEQPQVTFDIIMLSVDVSKAKQLGAQIRNKDGFLGKHINVQTGMLGGIVGNYSSDSSGNVLDGSTRLLSNLLALITGGSTQTGTTAISLGSDSYGVWGLVRMLQTHAESKVISNPFVIATNKYESSINVGETRRIASTTITNSNNQQQSYSSDQAVTAIKITPLISDNMVTLTINLENSIFTSSSGDTIAAGNKKTQAISTSILAKDGEVIALGGLTYERSSDNQKEVPWLSKIPIIGWFFKDRGQEQSKNILVIFIQPKIVKSGEIAEVTKKTCLKIEKEMENLIDDSICPIQKLYFDNDVRNNGQSKTLNNFLKESYSDFEKDKEEYRKKNKRRRRGVKKYA
jgi:general secretion pathway protein D